MYEAASEAEDESEAVSEAEAVSESLVLELKGKLYVEHLELDLKLSPRLKLVL